MTLQLDVKALAAEIAAAMPERLPRLLTVQQAAEILSCSTDHVVKGLVAAGDLVAVDISARDSERQALRITADSLREFAERRRVA